MGFGAEKRGDPVTRLIDSGSGNPGGRMNAGWITQQIPQQRQHGIPRFGTERRGGVVIEIDHWEYDE